MKYKKQIGFGIKIAVIIALFGFVWYKFANNPDLSDIWLNFTSAVENESSRNFLLAGIFLMPVNWLLEARKWQILIYKLEKIKLFKSLFAVLAGVTVSVFTPNRIGEYAGRVLFIKHENRLQAALSTLISSIGQIVATILAGGLSSYLFYLNYVEQSENSFAAIYLGALLLTMCIAVVLLYVSTPTLIGLLKRLKALKPFKKYVSFFNRYSVGELLHILLLSILRYGVYSLQFYLMLRAFSIDLSPYEGFIFIPITYFTLTVIPSVALAELGIREWVALVILEPISHNSLGILSATFLLWSINLLIPSAIGSALIFKSKIFK